MKQSNLVEYIRNLLKTEPEKAKQQFKDHWYSWNTIGGYHFEGVLLEVDNGTHIVLCTDGIKRAV